MPPVLSIVAPAYNEERNLPAFLAAMIPVLESIGEPFEIVFVDDGSRDARSGCSPRPRRRIRGSRSSGSRATSARTSRCRPGSRTRAARPIVPIDCDLQHPPELIPQFFAKWREGFEMVIGVRSKRDEEGCAAPDAVADATTRSCAR